MELEDLARIAYEVNAAYCRALGDNSQLTWKDAPDWQKDSVVDGVLFHLDNPEADASASHEAWSKDKIADGWVYGEIKDPEAKTHPCLVAFDKLPHEQQAKDYIFRQVIHSVNRYA
jgi:hypothetical protein